MIFFAAALLLSAPVLELSAELRDELRLRESVGGDLGGGPVAFDIQAEPALGMHLAARKWSFSVVYGPRLLAREPYARAHTEIMQRGNASFDAQLGEHWRFLAGEYASYGDYDVASLDVLFNPVNGKIDTLPKVTTLLFRSTSTQALLGFQPNNDFGFSLVGSYSDSGGVGPAGRAAVPVQKEARGQFSISGRAGRADVLVTNFAVAKDEFSSGQRYISGELSERFEHRFSRVTELDITAGAQMIRAQARPNAPYVLDFYPEGTIAVTHTTGLGVFGDVAAAPPTSTDKKHALEVRGDITFGPYFDRISGQVYQRASLDFGAKYKFHRNWAFEMVGGVVVSLKRPRQTQDVLALVQIKVVYQIEPYLALEAGARELVDAYLFAPGPPGEQWLTFVAFTWGVKGKV